MIARFTRFFQHERVTLLLEEEIARLLTVREGRVVRWGSAPIPRDAIAGGVVVDVDAVASAIRRLWEVYQPPDEGIILGVPGVHVATRLLPVGGSDILTDEDVRAAVARDLDLTEVSLDWQLVGPPSRRAVYVLAMQRAALETYLTALDLAGIRPIAVDLKQLALIRAVGHRHAILADLERGVLSVVIVDDALPQLIRIRPLQAALLMRPEDKVTRMAEILGTAIVDYNREPSGGFLHPAMPVHLSGALADQPLLQDVVRVVLGRPALQPKPPFAVPPDLPVAQYLANMGLALKRL